MKSLYGMSSFPYLCYRAGIAGISVSTSPRLQRGGEKMMRWYDVRIRKKTLTLDLLVRSCFSVILLLCLDSFLKYPTWSKLQLKLAPRLITKYLVHTLRYLLFGRLQRVLKCELSLESGTSDVILWSWRVVRVNNVDGKSWVILNRMVRNAMLCTEEIVAVLNCYWEM